MKKKKKKKRAKWRDTPFYRGYDIRNPNRILRENLDGEFDKKFIKYHRANKRVWRMFARFTLDAIEAGFDHYSARAVLHRMRWHTDIDAKSDRRFKLNNNYTPCYARLFHQVYEEHDGFFRTRERRVDHA
jgi:hypothetical protein